MSSVASPSQSIIEAEIDGLGFAQVGIDRAVAERVVFEHEESREMDRLEPAEGKDRVGRVGCAGKPRQSHGREKRAQIRDPIIRHRSDDDEMVLRRHGAPPSPMTPLPAIAARP